MVMPKFSQGVMEFDRRFRSLLLAAAVGVLAALFKLVVTPLDSFKMTVSCSHKPAIPMDAFLERDVLPTKVNPLHYDLTIVPDMTDFVFDGVVAIKCHPSLPLPILTMQDPLQ